MRSAPKGKPSEQFVAGRRIAQLLKQEVGPHLCASNIGRSSTIGGRPQGAFTPALSPDVREQLDPPSLAQPHIGQCLGGARFATCEFKVQFLDGTPESMVVGTWCPVSILLELATRGSRGSHRRACAAFRHTRMAQ